MTPPSSIVRRSFGITLLLAVISVVASSCASSPAKKEEKWPEATRTDWEHKEDPCKEKDGAPRSCSRDQDCCEGYSCVLDPERSRIARYCVEG